MEQRQPMEILNMKRYELPPPPAAKISDPAAWLECVENSCAQLEHQASRIVNLELMNEFGSTAWRIYNETLKTMFESAENQIEELRKQIQNVNLSRKTQQTSTGQRLNSLENRYTSF
jgi:pre-mRNA-splicing factor SPF27